MPVTTEPSAEPTPQFRRLVRNSPTLRACQREIFACFEQALADETGAAPDAVEPFTTPIEALISAIDHDAASQPAAP